MPTNAYFQKLFRLDQSLPQFPNQLCGFLDGKEFDENLQSLRSKDLLEVIDYLDKVPPLRHPICHALSLP